MAKVSLSISGVEEDMSSEEVRQKLSKLYGKPEQHFEKLCQSLFIMQQPYVLLKNIEQEIADKHAQRLTALGFSCDFGDGGLSLIPVAQSAGATSCCPACEQPCGDTDECQHCGVMMRKFAEQKKLDDQLQKQLQSAKNSHERIKKAQADEAAKAKAKAKEKAKQRSKQKEAVKPAEADEPASAPTSDKPGFTAEYKQKRNYAAYAAVAATLLIVGGGGFFVQDMIKNRYTSDAPDAVAASATTESTDVASAAATGTAQTDASTRRTPEDSVVVETTIFDEWTDRKRETLQLKNQIAELLEENMKSSAAGLVAGKTDLHQQVFGQQELLKLEGQTETTDRKLLSAYMLVLSLEEPAARVLATLNHSSVYRTLERHEEAVKNYDQAARLTLDIEDPQQRVLAETAIAEHQVDYGNLDAAREHYLIAKDSVTKLEAQPSLKPSLKTTALDYIAISEVTKGLTADAQETAGQIKDAVPQQQTLEKIAALADQNKVNGVPELAAAADPDEAGPTGDALIDDLIKINEHNKKTLGAASSLLGQ